MAKVIMTIAPEDGMCFDDIFSFKTENYVGMWDNSTEKFVLMRSSSRYFEPWYLDNDYETLRELDDDVFELCDEHIIEVFSEVNYTIELDT